MEMRTAKTAAHFVWCQEWLKNEIAKNPGSLGLWFGAGQSAEFWFLPNGNMAATLLAGLADRPEVSAITWMS